MGNGAPDTAALGGAQIAVPYGWLHAKSGFKARKKRRGQRDFGEQDQNLFAQT